MPRHFASVALAIALLSAATAARAAQGGAAVREPSDADIRQAMGAIERAERYQEIVDAAQKYQSILASARTVALAEAYLRSNSLTDTQRGLISLERQLALDCSTLGPTSAARLLSVRIIAGSALVANTPEQFAGVLNRFPELAGIMTVDLVHDALAMAGAEWPPVLLGLMEQLSIDWPKYGALTAATRMAAAAQNASDTGAAAPAAPQAAAPATAPRLPGHWRNTRIVFDSAVDEHLVLSEDGGAETWVVRASGREPSTRGRWRSEGSTLIVDWENGGQRNQPYTFYQGQLVLPNIANRRQFWDLLK
jgi:hypothetical protein